MFALLAAAGVYTFTQFYAFSQTRFFTVDEYQFGHATWLVAQGRLPYLDFFEHHFPLSYVLHAPFFGFERDSVASALLLRKIVFTYWIVVGVIAAGSCYAVTRDRLAAVLIAFVPASIGFGLMSAIDYRADNWGAFLLLGGVALLETNRRRGGTRGVSFTGGVLLALAVGMTQKMVFLAGGTALWQAGIVGGTTWMIATGLGSYLAYVPFNAVLFERIIASTRTAGTAVFAITLADAVGYTGSVGMQLYKDLIETEATRLEFFVGLTYVMATVGGVLFAVSGLYFSRQARTLDRSQPEITD